MSGSPNVRQNHFRTRTDANSADGGTPTWGANEDTDYYPGTDTNFRVRFALDNTGTANSNVRNLLYSLNGGTYTQVSTASNVIRSVDASSSTDNSNIATANFVLTAGSGTAVIGQYDESGTNTHTLNSSLYTELEFGIILRSADVTAGDTIDLRVYVGSTPIQVYTITPRITVPGAAGQPIVKRAGGVTFMHSSGRLAQNIYKW